MNRTVAILGAGICGLTLAYRRKADPSTTLLLEAAPEPGGSIRTLREEGFVLEGGPNTLRTNLAAERLLRDLGLSFDVVVASPTAPRYIVRDGRPRAIVPGPPGLFTSALSFSAKLRLLKEPFVPQRPASLEDESVHDFFARRFGPEVARYAAGPIVSGVYAGDPRALSVRSAFPRLWEAEARGGSVVRGFLAGGSKGPRHRPRTTNLRSGLRQLVDVMAQRVLDSGARLVTGVRVTALEGPNLSGPAWRIRTQDGQAHDADTVVSTLDAPALAALLGDRLPRSAASLSAVLSSPMTVVLQAFEATPETAPVGFGALIPRGEGFRALGVLYPESLFPGRCPKGLTVTTSFMGGALEPALAAASEEELQRLAEDEVRRLHPKLGKRVLTRLVRWKAAIPQLPLGHHQTLALLEKDLAELNRGGTTFVATGAWRDGVALGERIARGEELAAALERL